MLSRLRLFPEHQSAQNTKLMPIYKFWTAGFSRRVADPSCGVVPREGVDRGESSAVCTRVMLANESTSVFSDSAVSNMECTRNCVRRLARGDEAEFSNQSIFCAMDKFSKAVQDMDETILVPSRLLDLKVGDATDSVQPQIETKAYKTGLAAKRRSGDNFRDAMHAADLYNLYTMVNSVKNELLWGRNASPPEEADEIISARTPAASTPAPLTVVAAAAAATTTTSNKGHVRRPSTVSVTSTHSATSTLSDTDSEIGNENDSGIEGEESPKPDVTQQVAQNFRRHLHGLYRSLEQMTETAHYLTTRYQNDVGDAV